MWLFTERTCNGKVYKQMKKEVGYRDECIKEVPLWNFRIHEAFIKMIFSPRDIPINWMAKYRLDQDFVSSKTVVIKKKIPVEYRSHQCRKSCITSSILPNIFNGFITIY